jgi:hypothetical protein
LKHPFNGGRASYLTKSTRRKEQEDANMFNQGNGNGSTEVVYERERLRSRAQKLGLRLLKTREQSSQDAPHAAMILQNARLMAASAGKKSEADTDLGRCG